LNFRKFTLVAGTLACLGLLAWLAGACVQPQAAPAPTPTKTTRPAVALVPTGAATAVLPAIPTATPEPTLPPAATAEVPAPADTATLAPPTPTPAPPVTPPPTATDIPAPIPTRLPAPVATQPPLQGGSWDLEDGFYAWQSPYEGFTARVANGWQPFAKIYDPKAPPRLNENKYLPNIHSGERSQEVSFDWRSGETGIFRTQQATPGHRYAVKAWAKYAPSESGVQLYLGIDLTGGSNYAAGSVTWYPWRDATPNQWIATVETVRAPSGKLTIFLRSVHPLAADGGNKPGGNTMFDDVSLIDLGS
jgi:hypothetical protein